MADHADHAKNHVLATSHSSAMHRSVRIGNTYYDSICGAFRKYVWPLWRTMASRYEQSHEIIGGDVVYLYRVCQLVHGLT